MEVIADEGLLMDTFWSPDDSNHLHHTETQQYSKDVYQSRAWCKHIPPDHHPLPAKSHCLIQIKIGKI